MRRQSPRPPIHHLTGLTPADARPGTTTFVTAPATVVHRGRTMAVATAELFNEEGKRIAMASSSAMLLPDRPWSEIASVADRELLRL